MGISVIPDLLLKKPVPASAGPRKLGSIAQEGRLYRHPDSALISYPLVVQEPLGTINKKLNIAIVGAGVAGIAALYELCNLKNSSDYITVTIYESDPDNFILNLVSPVDITIRGLKAGRVSAAVSTDNPDGIGKAVYEIGAMRFPEIAGLMWHYAQILYGKETTVNIFPNPGAVPTEMIHGDRVDRFGGGQWLDPESPTKHVVDIVRGGLFGSEKGRDTSLFPIGGQDPAKVSLQLKNLDPNDPQLHCIFSEWKRFAKKYDEFTLGSAVKQVIERDIDRLPEVKGLLNDNEKINHYVELFGTVGFGTGGFKPLYNISLIEMMRLLLWNYSNEYLLPKKANVEYVKDLYLAAFAKNPHIHVKSARVCDAGHLDGNPKGDTLIVSYEVLSDGNEKPEPKGEVYDYVILTSTPRQTSKIISRIGFKNVPRKVTLGDYSRPLKPEKYVGNVRPALILSDKFETVNSKIYTAVNNIHMVSSSKIFATVKKTEFDLHAPKFQEETIKAVLSDCGLGSSYVVPSTILDESKASQLRNRDYYSFLISYAWEDVTKRLQHQFGEYPLNISDTKLLVKSVINRTIRDVYDPEKNTFGQWWFGKALSQSNLQDPLSYDWTTFSSAGAFKLDNAGDHYNTNLIFRYHTHALKPELKNKFFLANDSYGHLGGWIEGALMSAVNAVCGLVVAANGGDVSVLTPEAQKVVLSLDNVVEDGQ